MGPFSCDTSLSASAGRLSVSVIHQLFVLLLVLGALSGYMNNALSCSNDALSCWRSSNAAIVGVNIQFA